MKQSLAHKSFLALDVPWVHRDRYRRDFYSKDGTHKQVLDAVLARDLPALKRLLLSRKYKTEKNRSCALYFAAAVTNDLPTIRFLLKNKRDSFQSDMHAAIAYAIKYEHTEAAIALIHDGRFHWTLSTFVLETAVYSHAVNLVKVLLESAKIDFAAYDPSFWAHIIKTHHNDMLRVFLDDGRVDYSAFMYLRVAVASSNHIALSMLLKHNNNADPSMHHNALLTIAEHRGNADVLHILKRHPKIRDAQHAQRNTQAAETHDFLLQQ